MLGIASAGLIGCVGSESTPCGDEICPRGWTCVDVADHQTCVLPWQLTACAGLEGPVVCDHGDSVGYHCVEGLCLRGTCGDGVIDSTEECDDGTANSDTAPDTCRRGCHLPKCGDYFCDPGEDASTCPGDCAGCGDGVKGLFEPCDDGNLTAGDGCSPTCQIEP